MGTTGASAQQRVNLSYLVPAGCKYDSSRGPAFFPKISPETSERNFTERMNICVSLCAVVLIFTKELHVCFPVSLLTKTLPPCTPRLRLKPTPKLPQHPGTAMSPLPPHSRAREPRTRPSSCQVGERSRKSNPCWNDWLSLGLLCPSIDLGCNFEIPCSCFFQPTEGSPVLSNQPYTCPFRIMNCVKKKKKKAEEFH